MRAAESRIGRSPTGPWTALPDCGKGEASKELVEQMCGIAGVFAYRGAGRSVHEAPLLAAREAMKVRGPDGAGLWWDEAGRIGFAHRRLAIIDLDDRALQPMHMPAHGLTIIF